MIELYQQLAAQMGYIQAYACLGSAYFRGKGVEVDLQKAFDCFTKAAKHGNRAAENALNSKKFRDFKK